MLYTLNRRMGFVMGKILLPSLQSSQVINDHLAVISCFGKPDPPISAVTAYGPTSPWCTANPSLREDVYQQLQVAVDAIPKREVTVLMGAKVGKCCSTDIFLFKSMVKGKPQRQWWSFFRILWSIWPHYCQQSILSPLKTHHYVKRSTQKPDEHRPILIYNQIN